MHEVEQKMHLLLTDIRQATVANEETAQKVSKLAKQMEQVNRFVETLTGIAEQTNLLALNAAIEAARAGGTGRGFAVVADEIRKLATGSAESTLEIVSLARGIREKAEEAAGEVSDRVSLVQGNLEKGEEVVCSMRRLSEAFSEVVRALDIIGNKVEEQANRLQAINHEAGKVAAVSEQTAASFEEVTASAAEQSAATQRMEEHVNRLVVMAGRFQDLANQYTRESWDKETRERLVQEGLKVLGNLAENPDIKSLRVERLAGVFDKTFQSCSFLKTPLLVGIDGRVIYANFQVDKNMDWSFRPWFQGALKGERFVGQPYVTLNTNRPAITLSCPVKKETGEVIAVLAANVDKK
ncbi:MAG: methyl-accepting chemotaxis protein [Moorellaceae bacterium]